ncbi:3543_t:CDS:2 [Ambispora gerdemannii]|uniref:3543_t:CDS:1 n=1 Tax=Ambispora gerdemannii TaxID=144530 RepID=A0A9N9F1Z3_9GLOM|nr:3543_t:CDS:2 [Ambispora gerdemannii]
MFQIRPHFAYEKVINWFPGHMAKGLRIISEKLSSNVVRILNYIIIIYIPLSAINLKFEEIAGAKDRVIVYNKTDLADESVQEQIIKSFAKYRPNQRVIFTSANVDKNVKSIIKIAAAKAKEDSIQYSYVTVMVVGMPNVGKSTLINSMRSIGVHKGKAARTGALPGVTRSVAGTVKVLENPSVYLIDTPGVMIPHISDPINSLKVALTGGIRDHVADLEVMADYLLWRLNQFGNFSYVEKFKLPGPTDDINILLQAIGKRIGALQKGGAVDLNNSAMFFVKQYRQGKYGRYTLDDVSPEGIEAHFTQVVDPVLSKNQAKKLEWAKKTEKRLERWRKKGLLKGKNSFN